MTDEIPMLSVSDFISATNQTLEYAYPSVQIVGEVANFKVNQGKYVFFDLKDDDSSIGCFMTVWQLRIPLEDGMKIVVNATPKLTAWGRFSLTVQSYRPIGEGSLKKSFELLKAKLEKEGVFAAERKRMLPTLPSRIGVVTSTQAAGYADFVKILDQRWGGLEVNVAHVQVQGDVAADQMIRALKYFNSSPEPVDVIVLIRGGGSADDLAAFNDELLVRQIAESRIPTLVGVGHEVDTTLADLAADVRAATPSNAAQILVPDRREVIAGARERVRTMASIVERVISTYLRDTKLGLIRALERTEQTLEGSLQAVQGTARALRAYDPRAVLGRGYAIVRGKPMVGASLEIETAMQIIQTEVRDVKQKATEDD